MKHKTYWVQSFWFSACQGLRVTTGEYSFCFRLSPFDCTATASKEEPGVGVRTYNTSTPYLFPETRVGYWVQQGLFPEIPAEICVGVYRVTYS